LTISVPVPVIRIDPAYNRARLHVLGAQQRNHEQKRGAQEYESCWVGGASGWWRD
jgi:hypothetical protein